MCVCVTVNLYPCSLALNDQLSCPALDWSGSRSAGEFEVNHPVASCAIACIEAGACLSVTGFFCLLFSASLCGVLCELGPVFMWGLRSESSCLSFFK